MKKIIIYGCGTGADVATRYIRSDKEDKICAYTADAKYISNNNFMDLPLVAFEDIERQYPPDNYLMFIPLGSKAMNHLRAEKYQLAKNKGYTLYSYVSSKSFLHYDIDCGENCFILEGQAINFDVKIGNNVVMWSSNHVGDRTIIGDHVWLSSHVTIAGNATIKDYCFLGINATIANNIVLEPETFVGATCFITKNTKKGDVYMQQGSKSCYNDSLAFCKILDASHKL